MKQAIFQVVKTFLLPDALSEISRLEQALSVKYEPRYVRWLGYNNQEITDNFLKRHAPEFAVYIKEREILFNTKKFQFYVSRWVSEYLWKIFDCFEASRPQNVSLILEDNPLHRYALETYETAFATKLAVHWKKRPNAFGQGGRIFKYNLLVLGLALSSGLIKEPKKKNYKVMREALWGLYEGNGKYFHDDFFVDHHQLKAEDVLFFNRSVKDPGRQKAYQDILKSSYDSFRLNKLALSWSALFRRISPKYIREASAYREFAEGFFSIFQSLDLHFSLAALPYEKIFCHYAVETELGHNYFSSKHIPEAIVCENHHTKYYLLHWSDFGLSINRWAVTNLGCDKFLTWGPIHARGMKGECEETGFIFKKHIHLVQSQKENIRKELGLKDPRQPVVSFFDESFGGFCEMTAAHFINFWNAGYEFAKKNIEITVVIKPKHYARIDTLPGKDRQRFDVLLGQMSALPNVTILKENVCSFIEVIGISDVVVTQGMTSSSTIALICGINGLYFDEVGYDHPFSRDYKNQLVYNDSTALNTQIRKILRQEINPVADIPEATIRLFDSYADDEGLNRFRQIMVHGKSKSNEMKRKVGIIVQARMGSSRLPGKVMMPIAGKPMLEVLLERLKKTKKVDKIIVATTDKPLDEVIVRAAERTGVDYFRGDEDNVLSRYYQAADQFGLDVVIRITADCPLMDPALIDKMVVDFSSSQQIDYMSNVVKRTFPRGFDIEIFTQAALKEAYEHATDKEHKEHVTPYIIKHSRIKNYPAKENHAEFRVTVDTAEDFDLIVRIFEHLAATKNIFGYEDVINLLVAHPELVEINRHVIQKTS